MNSEMTTDNMSNEEVIEVLKGIVFNGFDRTTRKERQALDLAIKALERKTVEELKEELIRVLSSGDIVTSNGRLVGHINLEDIQGGAE